MHTLRKSGDIFVAEACDNGATATACNGDIADRTAATATDASQSLIYSLDPDKYRFFLERLIFLC